MRKTLAFVLAAVMVLSIAVVGVSAAPEGEAIKTAAEFLAMKADGTYYLDADITITTSYEEAFTGVLDGNGHTVTVSAPMFKILDGEVKNLTTVGEIKSENASAAAIAVRTVNSLVLTNVVNKANISVSGSHAGLYAAGLVCTSNIVDADNTAYYEGKMPANANDSSTDFVNCANYGNITVTMDDVTATSADEATDAAKLEYVSNLKPRAGGLMAVAQDCAFVNCTNDGDVKIISTGTIITSGLCGGMCARPCLASAFHMSYYLNCVNNGDVYSDSYSGGIAGYINGGSGTTGFHYCYGCTNNGTIRGLGNVGGMVGYIWASGSNAFLDLEYCVNTGKLQYGKPANEGVAVYTYVSGWVAYTNSTSTVISYNIDTGVRELNEGATKKYSTICSCSSCDVMNYSMEQNYILESCGVDYFCAPNSDANLEAKQNLHTVEEGVNAGMLTVLKDDTDIKSGKVAYEINEACKESNDGALYTEDSDKEYLNQTFEFYQTIGSDAVPSTIPGTKNYVLLSGDKYVNGEKPVETTAEPTTKAETTKKADETSAPDEDTTAAAEAETTAAAAETTKAAEEKKSGCGGAIGFVAVLALVPAALCIRKKED